MKKELLSLNGLVVLSREQQKKINGGDLPNQLTHYNPACDPQASGYTPTGCPCNNDTLCEMGSNSSHIPTLGYCGKNGVCA